MKPIASKRDVPQNSIYDLSISQCRTPFSIFMFWPRDTIIGALYGQSSGNRQINWQLIKYAFTVLRKLRFVAFWNIDSNFGSEI